MSTHADPHHHAFSPPTAPPPSATHTISTLREVVTDTVALGPCYRNRGSVARRACFEQWLTILKSHPTWCTAERQAQILGIKCRAHPLLPTCNVLYVQLEKTLRSKGRARAQDTTHPRFTTKRKWLLISWRRCIQPTAARRPSTAASPSHALTTTPIIPPSVSSVTPASCLTGAMRYAIRRQILRWKRQTPMPSQCPLCSVPVSQSGVKWHADHVPPATFVELKTRFLHSVATNHATLPTPHLFLHTRYGVPQFRRADRPWTRLWQQFHRKNVTLRWLCDRCNVRRI
jgi:hypothetical protein